MSWLVPPASVAGITSVVQDTSPQLGGTLDANGKTIDMGANIITDAKVLQWDDAYGWGDHSGTYEVIDATLVRDDDAGYNNSDWDTAFGWGDHASTYELLDAAFTKTDENQVVTAEWSVPAIIRGKTADYTGVLGDAGQVIRMTGSTAAQTITVPANSSVAYPIGTMIGIENDSSVDWTLAITTDTMTWSKDNTTGSRTLAAGASAVLLKTTATTWKVSGSALVT